MVCLTRWISPSTALTEEPALRDSDRPDPVEDPADLPLAAAGEFLFFFLFRPTLNLFSLLSARITGRRESIIMRPQIQMI